MPTAHEVFSTQFYAWERRGRGWQLHRQPVAPEPPFAPFTYDLHEENLDDGRRPTFLSSFIQNIAHGIRSAPAIHETRLLAVPEPRHFQRSSLIELVVSMPRQFDPNCQSNRQFLCTIFPTSGCLALEIVTYGGELSLQIALSQEDAPRVRKQISGFFPEVSISEKENEFAAAWSANDGGSVIFELGLEREFMFTLCSLKLDPYIGIAASVADMSPGEISAFQVIFEPIPACWNESIERTLLGPDQKPLFYQEPELTAAGLKKASEPLFGAVVRVAVKSPDSERAWAIARDIACACTTYGKPGGNSLIPLENEGYDSLDHEADLLLRQTRRSGMILTLDELLGFVHLPSVDVPKLARIDAKTKASPPNLNTGVLLGQNPHAGETREVRLSPEHRVRHTHIIGASGTGKTTLLYNLIQQDIENGQGMALLDPHGDLVDRILRSMPRQRIQDVVLIDPSDELYSVGFNILSAHSDLEKHLLSSDLVSIFERLSTSWGDQMGSVLQNAILAFLESNKGGTLVDLRRFLIEPNFRAIFLQTVRDSEVIYYWKKAFPELSGNRSLGPILTRLETFLAPKPIRYMVSQQKNRLDYAEIMNSGKIFLAKLSEGLLGKANSYLLGALLLAKFQQTAMGRQAEVASRRRDFYLYMDEFQNFISPGITEILTGARKYRLGLILAHHELQQLERNKDVASAVLSNCDTRIVFRVGDDDARALASGFSSFDAHDLQNLPIGHAICRVERSSADFNISIPNPEAPDDDRADALRNEIIEASRARYGTPRAQIEKSLEEHWDLEKGKGEERPEAPLKSPSSDEKPDLQAAKVPPAPPAQVPVPATPTPCPHVPIDAPLRQTSTRSPGRGGAQHKEIQRRIKREAEKLGFLAHTEKEISNGSIDLLLECDQVHVACEISLTTTIDHEVGNVLKCLDAGYTNVAVLCIDTVRLSDIESAVVGALGKERSSTVQYFTPDDFMLYLPQIVPPRPKPKDAVDKRLGYTVKRVTVDLSPEEKNEKERAMIRAIAEAMKKKRRP